MEKKKRTEKKGLSRRQFLKAGVAGAAAVGLAKLGGGTPPVFGQAPAAIKGTKLSILQVTYFIPAAQDL